MATFELYREGNDMGFMVVGVPGLEKKFAQDANHVWREEALVEVDPTEITRELPRVMGSLATPEALAEL